MPSLPTLRSKPARTLLAAVALGALQLGGCTADRTGSLRAMGSWIADDGRAFVRNVENAPQWLGTEIGYQTRDLVAATNFALGKTADDLRESGRNITGAPAWIGRSVSDDAHRLSLDARDGAGWIASDARTLADDVTGAPSYIAGQARYDLRDLGAHSQIIWEKTAWEFRELPTAIGRTLAIMFLR